MKRIMLGMVLGAALVLLGGAAVIGISRLGGGYQVLGFTLKTATRAEVEQWALSQEGSCKDGASVLRCTGLLDMQTVVFGFNKNKELVSVDLAFDAPDAEAAAKLLAEKQEELDGKVGEAKVKRGEGTADWIALVPMREATRSYRYENIRVELAAQNLGMGRFVVKEHHQAL